MHKHSIFMCFVHHWITYDDGLSVRVHLYPTNISALYLCALIPQMSTLLLFINLYIGKKLVRNVLDFLLQIPFTNSFTNSFYKFLLRIPFTISFNEFLLQIPLTNSFYKFLLRIPFTNFLLFYAIVYLTLELTCNSLRTYDITNNGLEYLYY